MLRGKLLPLVNGYPFTRMAESSNLHMWRRQRPKSWVRIQPHPLSLLRNVREKHLLCHGKDKKNPGRKKSPMVLPGNGPDDHLPSRCQCRRVLRGKLLPLVNGFILLPEWLSGLTSTTSISVGLRCFPSRIGIFTQTMSLCGRIDQ